MAAADRPVGTAVFTEKLVMMEGGQLITGLFPALGSNGFQSALAGQIVETRGEAGDAGIDITRHDRHGDRGGCLKIFQFDVESLFSKVTHILGDEQGTAGYKPERADIDPISRMDTAAQPRDSVRQLVCDTMYDATHLPVNICMPSTEVGDPGCRSHSAEKAITLDQNSFAPGLSGCGRCGDPGRPAAQYDHLILAQYRVDRAGSEMLSTSLIFSCLRS
jgi:hypothetical protein